MEDFQIYLIALIVIVIGVFVVRKIVGCMFRIAAVSVILIILAALYFFYLT